MTQNLPGRQRRLLANLLETVRNLDSEGRSHFFQEDNFSRFEKDYFNVGVAVCSTEALSASKLYSSAWFYPLAEAPGKKTAACFMEKGVWDRYRPGDVERVCPLHQPPAKEVAITGLTFATEWNSVDAATVLLRLPTDTPIPVLCKKLKENGHTMTLPQIEVLAAAEMQGDATGMVWARNSGSNHFFVETQDDERPVAMVRVALRDISHSPCSASLSRLEVGTGVLGPRPGRPHSCLFLPNFDPRTIGL